MSEHEFPVDVVAVEIGSRRVMWVYPTDTRNADSVIKMAVFRQGVKDRWFTAVKAGQLKAGDIYSDSFRG